MKKESDNPSAQRTTAMDKWRGVKRNKTPSVGCRKGEVLLLAAEEDWYRSSCRGRLYRCGKGAAVQARVTGTSPSHYYCLLYSYSCVSFFTCLIATRVRPRDARPSRVSCTCPLPLPEHTASTAPNATAAKLETISPHSSFRRSHEVSQPGLSAASLCSPLPCNRFDDIVPGIFALSANCVLSPSPCQRCSLAARSTSDAEELSTAWWLITSRDTAVHARRSSRQRQHDDGRRGKALPSNPPLQLVEPTPWSLASRLSLKSLAELVSLSCQEHERLADDAGRY